MYKEATPSQICVWHRKNKSNRKNELWAGQESPDLLYWASADHRTGKIHQANIQRWKVVQRATVRQYTPIGTVFTRALAAGDTCVLCGKLCPGPGYSDCHWTAGVQDYFNARCRPRDTLSVGEKWKAWEWGCWGIMRSGRKRYER